MKLTELKELVQEVLEESQFKPYSIEDLDELQKKSITEIESVMNATVKGAYTDTSVLIVTFYINSSTPDIIKPVALTKLGKVKHVRWYNFSDYYGDETFSIGMNR